MPFLLWLQAPLWVCGHGGESTGGHPEQSKEATCCAAREEKGPLPLGHPVPMCLNPLPSSGLV